MCVALERSHLDSAGLQHLVQVLEEVLDRGEQMQVDEIVNMSFTYSTGQEPPLVEYVPVNRPRPLTRRGFCPSACSLGIIEATAQ